MKSFLLAVLLAGQVFAQSTTNSTFSSYWNFKQDKIRNLMPEYICKERSTVELFNEMEKYQDPQTYHYQKIPFKLESKKAAEGAFIINKKIKSAEGSYVLSKDLRACITATTLHLQKLSRTPIK